MRKALPATIILSLLALIAILSPIGAWAQNLVWETQEQVFTDTSIHNVEVIKLEDGRYRMYFGQGSEIKSAISSDGRKFTVEEGVRLSGSMPALVILPDKSLRMYFQTFPKEGGSPVFKSATSKDGLQWKVEAGVRLEPGGEFDPDGLAHPSVIKLPEGGFRMYYDGETIRTQQDFTWRILSATSEDGLVWKKDEGVRIDVKVEPLEADLVWSPHIEYQESNGLYKLYFSVQTPKDGLLDGIYSATSQNGLTFTVNETPELAPQTESGEFGAGGQLGSYQDPFVLSTPQGEVMYYWVNGEGIYLAQQITKEEEPSPSWLERNIQDLTNRLGVDVGRLSIPIPKNWELYIIPLLLLSVSAAIFLAFWKSKK